MYGNYGVTNNRGLIALMHSADKSPVRDGPRNRSVHTEKLIPQLWEPGPCCDAKGYEPEVLKACPACEVEPYETASECDECGACMHCGGEPQDQERFGARHLCTFKMMHNGHEWRTEWMVRVKEGTPGAERAGDDDDPIWLIKIWLDVDLDLLDQVTWSTRREEILRGAELTPDEHQAMLDGTLNERLK